MAYESRQRLVLGTAQWGLDYGVTNSGGRLSDAAVAKLVAVALELRVELLDTAPAYGDAEQRIGFLAPGFRVQTKVFGGSGDVVLSLETSAQLLGSPPERALVHDWHDLAAAERARTASTLMAARDEGLVRLLGVSAYTEEDLQTALDNFDGLDVVQAPVSVLDQRLCGSQAVAHLRSRGGRLQARSVYLQGLAVAPAEHSPLARHEALVRFRSALAAAGVSPAQACRSFIRAQSWVDEITVGVANSAELQEWAIPDEAVGDLDWPSLASTDVDLIDPRRWPASL